MGMFDYISVEVPLPDGWEADELQTKDFSCELVRHKITKEGRLILSYIESTESVPKDQRPYPNEEGLLGLMGCIKTHTAEKELPDFHGWVYFHGLEDVGYEDDVEDGRLKVINPSKPLPPEGKRPIHKFHSYRAKFTDGKLQHIEVIADDS